MRQGCATRLAFFVGCLCLFLAPLAARAALPPDVIQRIQLAAQESRSLDQRDLAMARSLNSSELAATVTRQSGRHASAAMSEAVVGSISEYPWLTGEIVATAVAAAPGLRDSIVSDSIKAFPAFAPTIAAAGGASAPAGYYAQTPTYYGQSGAYYGQAPALAYGYEQPAAPAYGQQAMAVGAPDVGGAFADGTGGGLVFANVLAGGASEFIRELGNRAIATSQTPSMSLEEREAHFRGLLREGFDVRFIGRFSLGAHWRRASREQQRDYLEVFSDYFLQVYSMRLGGYSGETITVVSERPTGTKDVVVRTRIGGPLGRSIEAEWRVRTTENRYRIIDVMVEGVSMVITQRSEFSAVIQRNGVEGLIAVLRAHTSKSRVPTRELPGTASRN